jgi:autotransporter-associated beta strand protein
MRLAFFALLLTLISARTATAFEVEDRWTRTATNGTVGSSSSVGIPVTLTWSFAPDGTLIPGNTSGTVGSGLISFLDTNFPGGSGTDLTERPWYSIFQQSFDRISALSGLTFVYEPVDTGTAYGGGTAARGTLGVRGDIRIAGKEYEEGTSTLASNFYPDYGDMMINTDRGSFFSSTTNNFRRFRNTIMHEVMHGVGLGHVESSGSGFLIEPTISTSFDGPQLDDILGLHRLYGDIYEKNRGNDATSRATPMGVVAAGQSQVIGRHGGTTAVPSANSDFVSIDDSSDVDFFKFTLQESVNVTLSVAPQGATYMVGPQDGVQSSFNATTLNNLSLALFSGNGSTMLASVDDFGLGAGESLVRQLEAGDYYARVKGSLSNVQLYMLTLAGGALPPENLTWTGLVSSQWNVDDAVNFDNGVAAAAFGTGDLVRFDESAATRAVTIAENVSPGGMVVDTASDYVFSGPGGIVGGNLTVTGGGVVELANSNNSYTGATQVAAGTLLITGDANAMVSDIQIADGATLVLDATDAAAMASSIAVEAGGALQIGTSASSRNVFSDSHTGVVNHGTIRILDSEQISQVSGAGAIIVEQAYAEFAGNGAYDGVVTVKAGAIAEISDAVGLGSDVGGAVVEGGGSMILSFNGTLADDLTLAGDGSGPAALTIASRLNVAVEGDITLEGSKVAVRVEGGSTASFTGDATAMQDVELELDVATAAELSLAGTLTLGAGHVTKRGQGVAALAGPAALVGAASAEEGTLRLIGDGELAGDYQVASGAVLEFAGSQNFSESASIIGDGQVAGNIVMDGLLAVGPTIGELTLSGNLELTTTSITRFEAGGLAVGVDYDHLAVAGSATLGGTLELALANNFTPALGDAFELIAGNVISGVFDTVMLPTLAAELSWNVGYLDNAVVLSVVETSPPAPADFNGDGVVDGADLEEWSSQFGMVAEAPPLVGDADGSLKIDGLDFLIWQRSLSDAPAIASSVPEPAGFVLLLIGLCALWPNRIKKNYLAPFSLGTPGEKGWG